MLRRAVEPFGILRAEPFLKNQLALYTGYDALRYVWFEPATLS